MTNKETSFDLEPLPEINWTKVPFPSNRLTIGALRQSVGCDHESLGITLHNLALAEMEYASDALSEAMGRGGARGRSVFQTLKNARLDDLAALYRDAGLAKGTHDSLELVRELEAWASAEAKKHVKDRPR